MVSSAVGRNKLEIVLDRNPPIYYAGEVVKGSLTVTPDKNEVCRSLLVELKGKARVHWHTGGGDNRNDYYGTKIFLQCQRTLWGNFYRSACLDEAGEDANFGAAVGDGTMFIPCLSNEGSNGGPMRLIVRICDYDWGKKDDNIGEIVIDAKEVAMKNDAVTYNLTRNGKPEKGTITLAGRFVPSSAVTPDQRYGKPKNNVTRAESSEFFILTILKCNGLRKADWVGKNDIYVQVWRSPNDMPNPPLPGKKIPDPSNKITLPNGSTEFKFAFPTRADSPGSVSVPLGDYAYIAYYIYAKIDKRFKRDPSLKMPIIILPSRPLPLPQLLAPIQNKTDDLPIYSSKCCCFAWNSAGTVSIKLKLRRSAYAPGETIDMDGSQVTNDSTLQITVRAVLKQEVKLSTTGIIQRSTSGIYRFPLFEASCAPQSSFVLHGLGANIPALPPSFFGAKGLTAAGNPAEPLTFTYLLSVQAKAKSGHKVSLEVPLLVSALPPKKNAIDAAASMNPVQFHDAFLIQNFTVTDERPCDTVEVHTGQEDGGHLAPSVSGLANIWNIEEDMGSAMKSYEYQPQVSMYPSYPSNSDEHQVESSPPTLSATSILDTSSSPVNVEAAYEELLSWISSEIDPRLAVDKWIKKYPSVAACLSADQFSGALTKVLFSMEQAAVARELMSGLAPGVLTTSYIVEAMEACPFNKADIAKAMAKNASDPQNKDVVLEQLYAYERDDVSKMFIV